MNKMMKQLSAAALLVAGAMGGAQAAAISTVATDTQDVVFGVPGTASIAITPETGLQPGGMPLYTKVATVSASASAGAVAIRWTPGSGSIDSDGKGQTTGGTNTIIVRGKNTKTPMRVGFYDIWAAQSSVPSLSSSAAEGWWIEKTGRGVLGQKIITTWGPQPIVADAYPLSMDAAVWLE